MTTARLPTLALTLFAGTVPLAAQTPQAIYPLRTDLADATNTYGPVVLLGNPLPPSPPANGVCGNGVYLAEPGGQDVRTPVITTLDTSDFEVSVEFRVGTMPVNLFGAGPVLIGGDLWRWLGIYLRTDGTVGLKHNNANHAWSTTTLSAGTWYSSTVKFENGVAELYVNGLQVLAVPTGPLITGNATIDNRNFTTNDFSYGFAFDGCIRNLVIANGTTLGVRAGAFPYGSGCDGLTLGANGAPSLGNTLFEVVVRDVPAISPLAFVAFGSAAAIPGIELAAIGMPGCAAWTTLDLGMFGPLPVLGAGATFALPIPASPALTGTVLTAQGLAFSTATPIGLAASNGLQLVLAP